jgi:hypothetical protein
MYQPLNTVDSTHGPAGAIATQTVSYDFQDIPLTTSNPLVVGTAETAAPVGEGTRPLALKLLFREKKFDILDVSADCTVANLKERIFALCDVPVNLQRLIYNGRPMKPDDIILRALNIGDNAYIHLFPVPESNLAGMNLRCLSLSFIVYLFFKNLFYFLQTLNAQPKCAILRRTMLLQTSCRSCCHVH